MTETHNKVEYSNQNRDGDLKLRPPTIITYKLLQKLELLKNDPTLYSSINTNKNKNLKEKKKKEEKTWDIYFGVSVKCQGM